MTPYLTSSDRMITCDFMTYYKGKLKTLAAPAKMARGQMVSYLVQNRLTQPEQLQSFDWDGYEFEPELSDEHRYVFRK